jgi:cold shock protein
MLQLTESVVVPSPQVSDLTEVGRVKWFDGQKGFGFIESTSRDENIFVHISAVERAGLRGLEEGQLVRFQVVREKGRAPAVQLALV